MEFLLIEMARGTCRRTTLLVPGGAAAVRLVLGGGGRCAEADGRRAAKYQDNESVAPARPSTRCVQAVRAACQFILDSTPDGAPTRRAACWRCRPRARRSSRRSWSRATTRRWRLGVAAAGDDQATLARAAAATARRPHGTFFFEQRLGDKRERAARHHVDGAVLSSAAPRSCARFSSADAGPSRHAARLGGSITRQPRRMHALDRRRVSSWSGGGCCGTRATARPAGCARGLTPLNAQRGRHSGAAQGRRRASTPLSSQSRRRRPRGGSLRCTSWCWLAAARRPTPASPREHLRSRSARDWPARANFFRWGLLARRALLVAPGGVGAMSIAAFACRRPAPRRRARFDARRVAGRVGRRVLAGSTASAPRRFARPLQRARGRALCPFRPRAARRALFLSCSTQRAAGANRSASAARATARCAPPLAASARQKHRAAACSRRRSPRLAALVRAPARRPPTASLARAASLLGARAAGGLARGAGGASPAAGAGRQLAARLPAKARTARGRRLAAPSARRLYKRSTRPTSRRAIGRGPCARAARRASISRAPASSPPLAARARRARGSGAPARRTITGCRLFDELRTDGPRACARCAEVPGGRTCARAHARCTHARARVGAARRVPKLAARPRGSAWRS